MTDRDGAIILQAALSNSTILRIPDREKRIMDSKCRRPVESRNRILLQLHDTAIEPREDTAQSICGLAKILSSAIFDRHGAICHLARASKTAVSRLMKKITARTFGANIEQHGASCHCASRERIMICDVTGHMARWHDGITRHESSRPVRLRSLFIL